MATRPVTKSIVRAADQAAPFGTFRGVLPAARGALHPFQQRHLLITARSHIERLAHCTGGTARLGIEDGTDLRCIDGVDGIGRPLDAACVGGRAPLASTALGTALMLGMSPSRWVALHALLCLCPANLVLPASRRLQLSGWAAFQRRMAGFVDQGWTLEVDDGEADSPCIGAPVHDAGGRVVAAVAVSGAVAGGFAGRVAELGSIVRGTAEAISEELGWVGHG